MKLTNLSLTTSLILNDFKLVPSFDFFRHDNNDPYFFRPSVWAGINIKWLVFMIQVDGTLEE